MFLKAEKASLASSFCLLSSDMPRDLNIWLTETVLRIEATDKAVHHKSFATPMEPKPQLVCYMEMLRADKR